MALDPSQLPDDVATLKALLIEAETRAAEAEKRKRDLDAEIETLKLTIAKLQHERFGPSSERAHLLDQLELQLGELVEHAAQAATAAEIAAEQTIQPDGAQAVRSTPARRQPARRPLRADLPRERRVEPSPTACPVLQILFDVTIQASSAQSPAMLAGETRLMLRSRPKHRRSFSWHQPSIPP